MDIKKQRTKIIVSIVLFFLIFGILLTIATFCDLDINHFLTKRSLADHTYYTNDIFAASFESFGCSPLIFMIAFALHILFWYSVYYFKGAMRVLAFAATLIGQFAAYFWLGRDTLDYCARHLSFDTKLQIAPMFNVIFAFFALILLGMGTAATHNFSKESIKKLLPFAIALLLICSIPTLLINMGIKAYVGRIRYRAMNMYPDNEQYGFAAFARWYEVKGQWLDDETKVTLFGTADALKSFPSGHTCESGTTYGLIMLNEALGIKNKKIRALMWIGPLTLTGLVAVSRLVAGAHFMSDVLVGGTLSFVTMIIVREIFILKCRNIKILFGKNN